MGRPITQEDIDMLSEMKITKSSLLTSIIILFLFFLFIYLSI